VEASGHQWGDQEQVSSPSRVICFINLGFLRHQPAPRRGCEGLPGEELPKEEGSESGKLSLEGP